MHQRKSHEAVRVLGYTLRLEKLAGLRTPVPLSPTRASLIAKLRDEFGHEYDAVAELGSTLTLRGIEESFRD